MPFKRIAFFSFLIIILSSLVSYIFLGLTKEKSLKSPLAITSSRTEEALQKTLEVNGQSEEEAGIKKAINILLLGLDGRKGDRNPRCDAIHMITIDPVFEKIILTSTPRGTPVSIAGMASESAYISNYCHYEGIEKAVVKIEQIMGIKHDYTIKVGFSQSMGIFRTLGLPAVETLQFVRSRKYAIGDYQRNYNQANFVKDLIIKHTPFAQNLPKASKYLIFKLIDTDMEFEDAQNILAYIYEKGLYQNEDNFILETKPAYAYQRKDLHLDSSDSEKNEEYHNYQEEVIGYLNAINKKASNYISLDRPNLAYNILKTPVSQKLWLQVDDDKTRLNLQFDTLKNFYLCAPLKDNGSGLLLDFKLEAENRQDEIGESYIKQAEELLGI